MFPIQDIMIAQHTDAFQQKPFLKFHTYTICFISYNKHGPVGNSILNHVKEKILLKIQKVLCNNLYQKIERRKIYKKREKLGKPKQNKRERKCSFSSTLSCRRSSLINYQPLFFLPLSHTHTHF